MRTPRLGLDRWSSPPDVLLVVGALAGAFWLSVFAQALLGWPGGELLLVANLLVQVGLAIVVEVGTTRNAASGGSVRARWPTVVAMALGVPVLFLGVGIALHTVAFGALVDAGGYGVVYPVAVARWLLVLTVTWIAAVLGTTAAGLIVRRLGGLADG